MFQARAAVSAIALCALAGCAVLTESTSRYSDAPVLAPTPGWVKVMRVEPDRKYDAIGEVVLETTMNPAVGSDQLDDKLRERGAALGADAVIITYDRILPQDPTATNVSASRRRDPDWKRRVVGVAVKYRE
jgi:hypothetical protein